MLYRLLQFPARIALHFYCRIISINNKVSLKEKGPLILAANHPNSFLDAIIMASLFRQPIYSLARGDAFASRFITRLLNSFHMLPVYRITEGVENLENNYDTFDKVRELLKQNKTVLIFSEGRCTNEWHLRPLKKGTARLAISAWKNGIPVRVLPVGINYSSFRSFGKSLDLRFGNTMTVEMFSDLNTPRVIPDFNQLLKTELEATVFEIEKNDLTKRKRIFEKKIPTYRKILLAIPAAFGYLFNAPLYFAAHGIIKNRANDHYDSILVGILFIFYPIYLILITVLLWVLLKSAWTLLVLLVFPLTALALLHIRKVVR